MMSRGKDSSDSYLLKRRKAIAKAMAKEEFIAMMQLKKKVLRKN